MADVEVERVARYFATHALLLLAAGALFLAVAAVAVAEVVRAAAALRPAVEGTLTRATARVRAQAPAGTSVPAVRRLVPSAYLLLHLTLGFVVALALAVFAAIAEQVLTDGRMAVFDVAFSRALSDAAHPTWTRLFMVVSFFGTRTALAVGAAAVAGWLFLKRQTLLAIGWLAAQGGGGLLNRLLKEIFERPRPEIADTALAVSSWSFPSGHAMGTFVFCGVGCYLLVLGMRSWSRVLAAVTASAAWCLAMAFSRLYLGVHYASDVIAGMVAGLAWVCVCVSAIEVLRRRAATNVAA